MAENVGESAPPSPKRPKLSSPALSVSASDGTGNGPGMVEVANGSSGAGGGCSCPNPGMGNADIQIAETSQQDSPQMGGQASLRGPQPGAVNKEDDVGVARNNTEGPEHKVEKPGLGIGDESNNQQAAAPLSPAESRRQTIQLCIQSLVHACRCHDADCPLAPCHKFKRVIQHTKECKRRTNEGCPICRQLIALCCYHAKYCQQSPCLVPYCPNIKRKLREIQHRIRQARLLRRRGKAPAGG